MLQHYGGSGVAEVTKVFDNKSDEYKLCAGDWTIDQYLKSTEKKNSQYALSPDELSFHICEKIPCLFGSINKDSLIVRTLEVTLGKYVAFSLGGNWGDLLCHKDSTELRPYLTSRLPLEDIDFKRSGEAHFIHELGIYELLHPVLKGCGAIPLFDDVKKKYDSPDVLDLVIAEFASYPGVVFASGHTDVFTKDLNLYKLPLEDFTKLMHMKKLLPDCLLLRSGEWVDCNSNLRTATEIESWHATVMGYINKMSPSTPLTLLDVLVT